MECPKCGSECYDNRAEKASGAKSRKWPDFKCKSKSCDFAQWADRKGNGGSGGNRGGAPRAKWTSDQMAKVYGWAVKTAGERIAAFAAAHKVPFTVEQVVAGAATLFIGATNHGSPPEEKQSE